MVQRNHRIQHEKTYRALETVCHPRHRCGTSYEPARAPGLVLRPGLEPYDIPWSLGLALGFENMRDAPFRVAGLLFPDRKVSLLRIKENKHTLLVEASAGVVAGVGYLLILRPAYLLRAGSGTE
jgi:hypothetical protein